jgi:regulator of protease activity HflC (stomatin/prohibitin superfamily)
MEKKIELKENGFLHLCIGIVLLVFPPLGIIWLFGLFTVQPNQARVLIFFGKYVGTVAKNGFFWVNPFYGKKKVSLRVRNLETEVIKVNDQQGNPILISGVIVWKIIDTYKAIFDIETQEELNTTTGIKESKPELAYQNFVTMQAETALRKIAHSYPYDNTDDGNTNSLCLVSGVDQINEEIAQELKKRLEIVGIEIIEARISNLSYASEIAASMLQRQQAQAVIAARKKIVEGAVSMVEMAVTQLSEKKIIDFNNDQKAELIGNLMIVLCSDRSVSPVVDTSIHKK